MNKVILIGRLVAEPLITKTSGDKPMTIARYKLAVDRKIKRDGEQGADFPDCVAFGKNGEFAEKYLHKGMKIAVEGRLQTGSYTNKDGNKVYTTDVVIDSHEFCESKKSGGNDAPGSYGNDAVPAMPSYTPMMPSDSEFAMLTDDDAALPF